MTRYAIYFAPPADSDLWRFGSAAIGYDACSGESAPLPAHPFYASPLAREWTEEPRRYGFHATLKAPFSLAGDLDEADIARTLDGFARGADAVLDVRLRVAAIGRFLALVPAEKRADIGDLAAACVRAFEPLRAPLSDADLRRRLAAPLTPRQRDHLERFGYPYVFEDFRFHMTLTGPLEQPVRDAAEAALRELYAPVDAPVNIDAVCLFKQESRDGRFRIIRRAALAGGGA